ncbi:MAG: dihydroorotase [Candidatus Margulisiibacteriota bacterium]
MANLIIKNGLVIDPLLDYEGQKDIYITQGKITDKPAIGAQVIDAKGMIVCPGFIDIHVHLREPGQEEKETIYSGSLAAVKGGFTSICSMPNTVPAIDNASAVEYIRNRAKENKLVNIFPIAAITRERKGEELVEMGDIVKAGGVGFSDDGCWLTNSLIMRRAIEYAQMFGSVIISHAEDHSLSADGYMNESYTATKMGLKPIAAAAESVAVARDVLLAEEFGRVHIAHISTKAAVDIIRTAKKRGVMVTAETAPHYFSLTEEACTGYNTNAKVNPPLRTDSDVKAIIKGLQDGTIDAIATDHAPHTQDDKNKEFGLAAFGISGLETAFALGYTKLVRTEKLSLKQLIYKMTVGPMQILKLQNKGSLQVGHDADVVILDPDQQFTVDVNTFVSRGKNSPFNGIELQGAIETTIVGGRVVYENL